ncbi:MAG TPA: amidohydrolase family protein, partial [Limnochordales bacterium]|nr:amidohydrolase family protein [Limnochordales bacterium]
MHRQVPLSLSCASVLVVSLMVLTSLTVGGLASAVAAQPEQAEYDIIIRRGLILDGSGIVGYKADIGVKNGYIYAVGDLSRATARRVIDAEGLMVAPGFIDTHSHGDQRLAPAPLSSLSQGVTTEILNPDGGGPTDIAKQLADLEAAGLGINLGVFIGFNAVWERVVGLEDRR